MNIVVDTDAASFIFKKAKQAEKYPALLEGHTLVLSFQSLGELERWTRERSWGEARTANLHAFLDRFVILHTDAALCARWGDVTARATVAGRPISVQDAWVAACALDLDAPLLTENGRHFRHVEGLKLLLDGEG